MSRNLAGFQVQLEAFAGGGPLLRIYLKHLLLVASLLDWSIINRWGWPHPDKIRTAFQFPVYSKLNIIIFLRHFWNIGRRHTSICVRCSCTYSFGVRGSQSSFLYHIYFKFSVFVFLRYFCNVCLWPNISKMPQKHKNI